MVSLVQDKATLLAAPVATSALINCAFPQVPAELHRASNQASNS
jgi:hypothetical protein